MPSTSAESPRPRSSAGVCGIEPGRAMPHHPGDLRECLLRDGQRLGQDRDLPQARRHEIHVPLVVDDVFGHVAVGFFDAALGELAGVAVILMPGTAGQAAGMRDRGGARTGTTRSPTSKRSTAEPVARSRPATHGRSPGSHPRAAGVPYSKEQISLSVPQMPTSSMRSSDLVGLGEPGLLLLDDLDLRDPGKTETAFMFSPVMPGISHCRHPLGHSLTLRYLMTASARNGLRLCG